MSPRPSVSVLYIFSVSTCVPLVVTSARPAWAHQCAVGAQDAVRHDLAPGLVERHCPRRLTRPPPIERRSILCFLRFTARVYVMQKQSPPSAIRSAGSGKVSPRKKVHFQARHRLADGRAVKSGICGGRRVPTVRQLLCATPTKSRPRSSPKHARHMRLSTSGHCCASTRQTSDGATRETRYASPPAVRFLVRHAAFFPRRRRCCSPLRRCSTARRRRRRRCAAALRVRARRDRCRARRQSARP